MILALYYAAFLILGMAAAVLGPTLPSLAEQSRVGLGQVGILFTGRALGYLVGSWRSGHIYDHRPGHPVMVAGLLLLALSLTAIPFSPWLALLFGLVVLLGIAEGGIDVGGNTLLLWRYGHRAGPFMNGLHFFFGLGAFLAPVVVAQALSRTGGVSWAFWGLALLAPVVAIILSRQPSPPSSRPEGSGPTGPVNRLVVGLILAVFFLYVGAEIGFSGWIFSYARAQGVAEERAAYLTATFWGAFTIGRLLAIPLAGRVRPSRLVAADWAGCLVGAMALVVWPGSPTALWLGTALLGLAMAAIFPTMLSVAERRIPISGRVTSWFFIAASFSAMLLPWLMGQFFDRFGPSAVMLTLLADILAATLAFATLLAVSRRQPATREER
jgi:FHS family Na+ dependent glucose MFS transporter 1